MSSIEKIDQNFAVQTNLHIDGIRFYDIQDAPFTICGLIYENGLYRRMPEHIAKTVSPRVYDLHVHTAGGRVKFVTNSSFVAIKAEMPAVTKMAHFPLSGSGGFDLYVGKKEQFHGSFVPRYTMQDGYESVIRFESRRKREITINFPLYSSVSSLYIGLEGNAVVEPSAGYKNIKPMVFYGSSITQGACASRPGNSYTNTVSRTLGIDYINLGFSGNARGEQSMADYIASLDMSVFIYDYDYNAPDPEHLQNTHQKMFQTVRNAHPELPIIILSRPKYKPNAEEKQRLEIIKKTYSDAIAAGDKNVYFIDGKTLMKYAKDNGTLEGCHPNDLGFYSMAKVLLRQLKPLFKEDNK